MNNEIMMNEEKNEVMSAPAPKKRLKAFLKERGYFVALALVFCMSQVIGVSFARGHSMEPTMHDCDLRLVLKMGYTLRHGDVIIFKAPAKSEHKYWVKRVIGLPGDVLQFDEENNVLYRNGEVLDEPYLAEGELVYSYLCGTEPFVIEEGYVFVMGDNRQNSTDSRYVGAIPIDNVIGEVLGVDSSGKA